MADGFNRVMLLGNLGADPELRFTAAGQAVLNIRLATTESYLNKDQERVERTDWHSVVVWGKRAEALAKILTKGSAVFIEGGLRTSSYEKDGVKHYKVDVNATHISLVGSKGANEPDPPGYEDRGGAAPSGGGYAPRAPAAPRSSAPSGGATDGDFEVRFGRDKGKRISEVADLSWLRGTLERDLGDASKEKYHNKARAQMASIDAEVARRNGGGGAAPAPQLPADDYELEGGGGGDDDIPF
jgi:single-strand DNA-binding protein